MVAPTDIVNQALDAIGSQTTVQNLSPPSPPGSLAAQVAARNYQQQFDNLARAANWNCLRLQAPLTLLKAALGTPENPSGALPQPPFPWQYEYAEPSDCIKVRFLMPLPNPPDGSSPPMTTATMNYPPLANPRLPFVPAIDTDANGNQIRVVLSNARQAQVVYTGRVANPDLWDPLFRAAFIASLAAIFVNPLNRNAQLLKEKVELAVSLIMQARIADANEGVTTVDHYPDFLQVRNVGGGIFTGLDGASSLSALGWTGYGGDFESWIGADGVSY